MGSQRVGHDLVTEQQQYLPRDDGPAFASSITQQVSTGTANYLEATLILETTIKRKNQKEKMNYTLQRSAAVIFQETNLG